MGFHNDSRLIVVDSGQERTRNRGDKTVVELGCVLPEVPDIAFQVLSKEIKGIFRKYVVGVDRIMYFDTSNPINDYGVVSYGKDVFDRSGLIEIGKGCARNERKIRVIYSGSEVSRIDGWVVTVRAEFLTTRLSHVESSLARITRISQIGRGLLLARLPRCRVSDINAFTKRNLVVTLCRRLTRREGITCGFHAEVGRLCRRIFVLRRQIPDKDRRDREDNDCKCLRPCGRVLFQLNRTLFHFPPS